MTRKKGEPPSLAEQYLSRQDLEHRLQVSRATVYRWMDQGLPSFRIQGKRRYDPRAVAKWLEEQKFA